MSAQSAATFMMKPPVFRKAGLHREQSGKTSRRIGLARSAVHLKAIFRNKPKKKAPPTRSVPAPEIHTDGERELSFGELSALCSNLSKGCEKQYRPEEASLFMELAEYYQSKSVFI